MSVDVYPYFISEATYPKIDCVYFCLMTEKQKSNGKKDIKQRYDKIHEKGEIEFRERREEGGGRREEGGGRREEGGGRREEKIGSPHA
jgi:hypothetical protein